MATTVLVNSTASSLANTVQSFYTSPAGGGGTIITAFTATNNTGANASFRAYIFDSSGAILGAVLPLKVVIRNRFDPGNAIVNQVIPAGGSLQMETNIIGAIDFRVTGNEL